MGRRALLVIAAMLVAAFGTGMIWLYVNGLQDQAFGDAKPISVWRTKVDLPKGTQVDSIRASDVERVKVINDVAGLDPVVDFEALRGKDKIVLERVGSGLLLQNSMFGGTSVAAKALISKGYLATEMQLGDPMRVAGLLQPDSKVTIFITHTSKDAKITTEVLLSDVTVLATNGYSPVQDQNGTVPKNLVTFLVKPMDAARLIHAQSKAGGGAELWLTLQGETPPSPLPLPVTSDNLISGTP